MVCQEPLNLPNRPVSQGLRRQLHFGGIQVPLCLTSGAVDAEDRDWRTEDDDEQEDEDEGAECGKRGLSAAPAPDLFGSSHRSRLNRFVIEEAAQFVGEFLRGHVAAQALFFQALKANRLQIRRHAEIERARSHHLGIKHLVQDIGEGFAQEWRTASQTMIKDGTERIDVAIAANFATG
jgi:hypothetical protein